MSNWKRGIAATPLASISAIVLDTETTGLDVQNDRILQFGAVRLRGDIIEDTDRFSQLVNPFIPIPPASTKIHKITDRDVADQPGFTQAYEAYTKWAGIELLLGFSIGFDLAILQNECRRHNLRWVSARTMDIRHLVKFLPIILPDYGMETIAEWLEVDIEGRHNALGDAIATAKLFRKLVPKLAENGVVSLKQAERACLSQRSQLEDETKIGWHDFDHASRFTVRKVNEYARIDSFPFRHRVGDIMSAPPILVHQNISVNNVLTMMMEKKISSVFVSANDTKAAAMGIVTERDILRAICEQGTDVLGASVDKIANFPVISIDESEFAYKAISTMSTNAIRHLGIHDAEGIICGALSARDLLRQRSQDAFILDDEIEESTTPESLGEVWSHLAEVTRGLVAEDVDSRNIAAIISRELRALTKKACVIAEREMRDAGSGDPPVEYCMLVLGSGGRGESLLAMDQDNAIIYENGARGGVVDQWFESLGKRVSEILHRVGVPYCHGGIMASNSQWRMDIEGWRGKIENWLTRSSKEDIMNSDIFFDCREVHGNASLLATIRSEALESAGHADNFLKLLSVNAARFDVPLNWRGKIKTSQGRVDLKMGGLMPLFSTARVLALRHSIDARATPERLLEAKDKMTSGAHLADDLCEAHRVLLDIILKQQLRDIDAGHSLSNRVNPTELSKYDLEILTWAIGQCSALPDLLDVPLMAR